MLVKLEWLGYRTVK